MQKAIDRSLQATKGNLSNFGYGRYSAQMNMAIDEALFSLSCASKKFFVRFYDFSRPSVILAVFDSPNNFVGDSNDSIDITRRITSGKPIYIDDNALAYCITGPILGSL